MSFYYKFDNEGIEWKVKLFEQQCIGTTKKGTQCSRNARKHLPCCASHLSQEFGVEVKKSTLPNAGEGLFATRFFFKGDFIGEYFGERLTENQINERYGNDGLGVYLFVTPNGTYVDSALVRSYASFINHQYDANTNAATDNNIVTKVIIRAKKTIKPGEEIFINYGREYWSMKKDFNFLTKFK